MTSVQKPRSLARDVRAASRLIVDATTGTTSLVEQMHHTIAGVSPFAWPAQLVSGLVYTSVRGITHGVGAVIDQVLTGLDPLIGETDPPPELLAAIAALNGLCGDLLEESGSELAQPMELHRRGVTSASPKIAVLLHGSSMNELQWERMGHDHGAALERELGYSAVYSRYNSGLHVSTNGERLAAELEHLVQSWPVPVGELVLIGFSMGGLVARSACRAAEDGRMSWRHSLRALITLGTPHHGAPLERAGNWFETALGLSPFSAPLGKLGRIRSAGVTDLRFGYVLEAHWKGRNRFALAADRREPLPLPSGVRCFAIAATRSRTPGEKLSGDGLVPVASALGVSDVPQLDVGFPAEHQQVVYGASHLDLLSRPEVWEAMRKWLV